MPRRYTVTEIAEIICAADGLELADHTLAHSQVRNLVRRGMLANAQQVDARGTVSFPALEVYRARIFNALADLSMDVRVFREVLEAAAKQTELQHLNYADRPPSLRRENGWASAGSLIDSIKGVAMGEPWSLVVKLYRPGHTGGNRIVAAFSYDRKRPQTDNLSDQIFGTGPAQALVTINLAALYDGLPPLDAN